MLSLLVLLGCAEKDEGNDKDPPPLGTDVFDCHKTDPVITDAWLLNTGIQDRKSGSVATWTVGVDVEDDDGELWEYRLEASFDQKVDGMVEADTFNTFVKTVENAGERCEVTSQTLEYAIAVTGEFLEFDTEYEWGLVVYDATEGPSEMAILDGISPNKDGSDGG